MIRVPSNAVPRLQRRDRRAEQAGDRGERVAALDLVEDLDAVGRPGVHRRHDRVDRGERPRIGDRHRPIGPRRQQHRRLRAAPSTSGRRRSARCRLEVVRLGEIGAADAAASARRSPASRPSSPCTSGATPVRPSPRPRAAPCTSVGGARRHLQLVRLVADRRRPAAQLGVERLDLDRSACRSTRRRGGGRPGAAASRCRT